MAMSKIRVIIIDDSAFMRKVISDILTSDNRMEVIATARNGEDGINKVKKLQPDVVTLDIHMPIMDGITALRELMNSNPIPVVMLSSAASEDTTIKTVQAISSGAVDFITKPSGPISIDIETMKQEIISKVITASKVRLPLQQQEERAKEKPPSLPTGHARALTKFAQSIVAIGTSTGGPRALQQIITRLPKNIKAPVFIVQHMPAGFTKSLAERLNQKSQVTVKEAIHGEIVKNGTVYIAPGDLHMKLKSIGTSVAIELTKEKAVNGHRPSVDVLFTSLANVKHVNKLAVVLTGMGSDGSNGIKALKAGDKDAVVIAESEESAVVYGMPKAAVRTNLVTKEVVLSDISGFITKLL